MEITDSNFDELVSAEDISVVGFGAPWCGTCRHFRSVLEDTANKAGLPLYELVVDDNPQSVDRFGVESIPVRYSVRGVPTVIVFEKGQEKGRIIGSLPEDKLLLRLNEIVASPGPSES